MLFQALREVHHVWVYAPSAILSPYGGEVTLPPRFLARNALLSWRVTLGFLFLFCRSYSSRCTSSDRPPTRRRCSYWPGASPWTCTRGWNVTGKKETQMNKLFWRSDCLKNEAKTTLDFSVSFRRVLFVVITIKQLSYLELRGLLCRSSLSDTVTIRSEDEVIKPSLWYFLSMRRIVVLIAWNWECLRPFGFLISMGLLVHDF